MKHNGSLTTKLHIALPNLPQTRTFKKNNNKWLKISEEDVATINNALAIISGYAQLLSRKPDITSDEKEKLNEIIKRVFRIAELLPK